MSVENLLWLLIVILLLDNSSGGGRGGGYEPLSRKGPIVPPRGGSGVRRS
jgi:hypothetical protein